MHHTNNCCSKLWIPSLQHSSNCVDTIKVNSQSCIVSFVMTCYLQAGIINEFCFSAGLLMLRRNISFCLSGSFVPFRVHQLIPGMGLGLGSAVLRTLFIMSANASFIYSQQECIGAQMTPFPAQWHHLAVEDVLNFHSDFFPLASCSFLSPPRRSFLWLHKHPQTALSVPPRPIFLSPWLSSSYFHRMPLPFSPPFTAFIADSSAPQEHWGELRKQRFGSVALILIFCRLDGRLGRAFIHTPNNHFHFHCNWNPWLQTTGVVAISANVPSVTRRLCFLPKTMTSAGTQCTEHLSQRNSEMHDG